MGITAKISAQSDVQHSAYPLTANPTFHNVAAMFSYQFAKTILQEHFLLSWIAAYFG
jgi:hypothetical protein